MLTQWKFFSWAWRQSETKYSHRCNENTGNNEIEEVVECSPSNLDDECDVQVGLGTTVIKNLIAFSRNTYKKANWLLDIKHFWLNLSGHTTSVAWHFWDRCTSAVWNLIGKDLNSHHEVEIFNRNIR